MIDETLRQVLDDEGRVTGTAPEIPDADLRALHRHMLKMRTLDQRMLSLQRQGRIGFYGLATGQEAAITGSAYPLRATDWIFPALRETGVSLWRGTTVQELVCQLIGNAGDVLIGRQMPMHFSDRKVNSVAWSSVIGTQLVHAMGAAWAAKIQKKDDVMVGYIGDGGTSSSDFHAALNFAAVKQAPVVFFCQNNQWAISVPLSEQTVSSSIAIKAAAYGMRGVRVDGNDLLAVIAVMREAVERARSGGGPTFVEALTFRMGGHSSSDDPTRYRDPELVKTWEKRDPVARFGAYLRGKGLLTDADVETWTAEIGEEISQAVTAAEAMPAPALETIFTDVYAKMPAQLETQMKYALALGAGTKFDGAFPL
ncbi:MAG: thiamine pyrophosphate-dependent dehydrogenase E1 component subunit alpha [Candidatus Eisenbacteria bacterium]|uniref:2-oxoisovalerate dehydrogenase subunit alpha n=1 Tax=Eiseniibacteriota bacterium TaxID=2212470 RepID=A0A933W7M7_UNCEI|nr:thiamine pyrophosphate-dependent dehydrogenase E1 component subunit alpha [Candidatus Eisenbacteria bacterium]